MEIKSFLKLLLYHGVLAAGFFFLCAVALEKLLPGFVAPFVNLPEFGLGLFVLSALSLWLSPGQDRGSWSEVSSWVVFLIALVASTIFGYARLNQSLWQLGLLAAVLSLATVFIYSKVSKGP